MSAVSAVSTTGNARQQFEAVVRKMTSGYASTINGISQPMRLAINPMQPVQPAQGHVGYKHVIDTWA